MLKGLIKKFKNYLEYRAWKRELDEALKTFEGFGIDFYVAAFAQKHCVSCDKDLEIRKNVAGKLIADINVCVKIILYGWTCECGHRIPSYLDRFGYKSLQSGNNS